MMPFGDLTSTREIFEKAISLTREVTQAVTGVTQLVTALAAFVVTVTGRAITGRPIVLPAQVGQPRPRIFSPKAILKGWIVTALAYAILGGLLGIVFAQFLTNQRVPGQFFQQKWVEFVTSAPGVATCCLLAGLACALGAHSAAKQAKCFRLTHALFSVGTLYLGLGLITSIYFPAQYEWSVAVAPESWTIYFPAQYEWSVAVAPESWKMWEPVSTLIGTLVGGIMGAED